VSTAGARFVGLQRSPGSVAADDRRDDWEHESVEPHPISPESLATYRHEIYEQIKREYDWLPPGQTCTLEEYRAKEQRTT
jgi:hypothetical protein